MNNSISNKLRNCLWAGIVAITVQTLFLKMAPFMRIEAESGGLLKLLIIHIPTYINNSLLSFFHTTSFGLIFHYLTGFAMVLLYVYIFEPLLPGKGWQKGSLFSLLPWLINGFIVLPLLGQGIAGFQRCHSAVLFIFLLPTGYSE